MGADAVAADQDHQLGRHRAGDGGRPADREPAGIARRGIRWLIAYRRHGCTRSAPPGPGRRRAGARRRRADRDRRDRRPDRRGRRRLAGRGARAAAETRFLTTLAYEQWMAASTANRWARLTRAWLVMNRQPGLIGRRTTADRPRVAAPRGRRPTATVRSACSARNSNAPAHPGCARPSWASSPTCRREPRRRLPRCSKRCTGGRHAGHRGSRARPRRPPPSPVRWTLAEAAQLGLTGLGGLTDYGRMLLAEAIVAGQQDPDDDPLGLSRPDTRPASPAVGVAGRAAAGTGRPHARSRPTSPWSCPGRRSPTWPPSWRSWPNASPPVARPSTGSRRTGSGTRSTPATAPASCTSCSRSGPAPAYRSR